MLVDASAAASQLTLLPSPYCSGCPLRGNPCTEQFTALGCSPFGPPDPNLLHPTGNDWLLRIGEVGGFQFDNHARSQDLPELPLYVPRVRLSTSAHAYQSLAGVAISLRDVERLASRARERGSTARRVLGLADHQLLIVLGFEKDAFLEKVWWLQRRRQLIAAIREVAPDVACAWSYSVWHRHAKGWLFPRVEHLYNLKRSLNVFTELQQAGVPAIPHLYWGTHQDLRRWSDWIAANPSVTTVAIDLQTADWPEDWQRACRAVAAFRAMLPRDIHVLFSGVCQAERVWALRSLWPSSTISNFGPEYCAYLRRKPLFGLSARWTCDAGLTREQVFALSANEYRDPELGRVPELLKQVRRNARAPLAPKRLVDAKPLYLRKKRRPRPPGLHPSGLVRDAGSRATRES